MEKLVETGKTKAIGVSNVSSLMRTLRFCWLVSRIVLTQCAKRLHIQYSKRYLEQLLPEAKIVPAVNQIENHPQLPQQEIVDLCKEKGIHIMAYSPFGSTGGPLFEAEPVKKIAEKHGVPATSVLLGYHSRLFPSVESQRQMRLWLWLTSCVF